MLHGLLYDIIVENQLFWDQVIDEKVKRLVAVVAFNLRTIVVPSESPRQTCVGYIQSYKHIGTIYR